MRINLLIAFGCGALLAFGSCKGESKSNSDSPKSSKGDELKDELPEFKAPGDGPKAPVRTGFAVEVGKHTVADVKALTAGWGLDCKNTSMRAMMEQVRERKRQEIADKRAKGESLDGISGASALNKRSKREKNPQVRWTCNKIPANKLKDRNRGAVEGRLLFVFDSESIPLRHVSYRRAHTDVAAAAKDFMDTTAALTRLYGEPSHVTDNAPKAGPDGQIPELPKMRPVNVEWTFADLAIKVSALRVGKRVTLSEAIEVPWPVWVVPPK